MSESNLLKPIHFHHFLMQLWSCNDRPSDPSNTVCRWPRVCLFGPGHIVEVEKWRFLIPFSWNKRWGKGGSLENEVRLQQQKHFPLPCLLFRNGRFIDSLSFWGSKFGKLLPGNGFANYISHLIFGQDGKGYNACLLRWLSASSQHLTPKKHDSMMNAMNASPNW